MAGIALIIGGYNSVINNAIDCNLGLACINVFPDAVSIGGHFIQYNDFYAEDPTGKYRWDGVLYNSLAEWEAASGQLNNIDSIPGFAEPDSEDLHLITGSACIDAGTPVNASSEDYEGRSRPQGAGYDIGAYEFEPVKIAEEFSDLKDFGQIISRPNPSMSGIWIKRSDPASFGRVRIFDISGRIVYTLKFIENQSQIYWDRKDKRGILLPAGNYYLVYTSDLSPVAERKIILLK
jgi:hypothetical protein